MLADQGFMIVPGPFAPSEFQTAVAMIKTVAREANAAQLHVGSTGTNVRIEGLLDRAPGLSALFTHEPLLRIASEAIGGPFRLSGFHLRNLLPGAPPQALHQDVAPNADGWPLIGFIFMLDEFSEENGATRFVPKSDRLSTMSDALRHNHPAEIRACGSPGSMILFDGSVWHGWGANRAKKPRRSVYGALIPAHAAVARDYPASLPRGVWEQMSAQARKVLTGVCIGTA